MVCRQEDINAQKSKVRIAKQKYLTAMGNVQFQSGANAQNVGAAVSTGNSVGRGLFSGATGALDKVWGNSASIVTGLASEYERALTKLTDMIGDYNAVIGSFPTLIIAGICRFKREKFVDEDNLEKSTVIQGFDDSML